MKRRDELFERGLAAIDPLADDDLQSAMADSDPSELLSSILATSTPGSAREYRDNSRRLPTRRWRKPVLIAAPAAGAALVALAVGIPGGGGSTDTLPALARVAEAAAAQPAPTTDLPFQYSKTREIGMLGTEAGGQYWSVIESGTQEEWIGKDGSGLVHSEAAAPKWASPGDRAAWEASGRIPFLAHGWKPHTEERRYGPGHFGEALFVAPDLRNYDLAELPTEPEELAAWLEGEIKDPRSEDNGTGATVRTMTLVTDLLHEPLAPPELRAALYEALGLISGVESFGEVTDAAGRKGIAVGLVSAYTGAPTRFMLIFDPKTSQLLATEEISLERRFGPRGEMHSEKSPLLTSATLFLESRGADSLGG